MAFGLSKDKMKAIVDYGIVGEFGVGIASSAKFIGEIIRDYSMSSTDAAFGIVAISGLAAGYLLYKECGKPGRY
jgi:hypothetical protein